jgi:methionyl-tRNA formyltransferase
MHEIKPYEIITTENKLLVNILENLEKLNLLLESQQKNNKEIKQEIKQEIKHVNKNNTSKRK